MWKIFSYGSNCITTHKPQNEYQLVKARDLEGLVVKRKDGRYRPETKWFKILNPEYSQKAAGRIFSKETNSITGQDARTAPLVP
jgi:hypothetical protein